MVGWVDQEAAAAWLAHASLLIFTSRGPESLSRVLIEASALGVPIAAMNTGGTPDIVVDEETGLLSDTPEELAADSAGCETTSPAAAARRGGDGARRRAVRRRRDTERIEQLYLRADREARDVSAPLRVAIVARSVFPLHGHGGLERHVYDLTRYLADAGIQVTLITREPTAEPGSRRAARSIHPRIRLITVPYRTFPLAGRRGTTVLDRSTAYPLFGERAGRVALDLVKRGEIDLVHGSGASVLGYARQRASSRRRS